MQTKSICCICTFIISIFSNSWNLVRSLSPNVLVILEHGNMKFPVNKTELNNFVILKKYENEVIIGGRNNIYKMNIEELKPVKNLHWPSNKNDTNLCLIKGKSKEECQNYLRIYGTVSNNSILVCGTNAFQPLCRKYQETNSEYVRVAEFSGEALCPYSPYHESTFTFVDGELYTATLDFSGQNPRIYREPVKTKEENNNQLYNSKFVASFHHDKFVYFFFREESVEHSQKKIYSRVGRVCTNDKGFGLNEITKRWTSFFKTRITCRKPGIFPYYFDEIYAVSDIVEKTIKGKKEKIVYATFTTSNSGIYGSAVCAFRMRDIEKSFEGDFKFQRDRESQWLPLPASKVPNPRPGTCSNSTGDISIKVQEFLYSYIHLMNEVVQSFIEEPVYIEVSNCRITSISVDPQVETLNGMKFDILFLGTNCGKIIKAIYSMGKKVKKIIVEMIRVAKNNVTITELLVHKNKLMVITPNEIYSIPKQRCQQNAKTCRDCVGLQDPYCAWDETMKICTTFEAGKNDTMNFIIQNIEGDKHFCLYDDANQSDKFYNVIAIVIVFSIYVLITVCITFFMNKTENITFSQFPRRRIIHLQ
ncbi:semaphorin-1A-like isoform X2 [Centruroides vittatus]